MVSMKLMLNFNCLIVYYFLVQLEKKNREENNFKEFSNKTLSDNMISKSSVLRRLEFLKKEFNVKETALNAYKSNAKTNDDMKVSLSFIS